ncbi:glycosyltransferase [Propionispora hippei]|uniref:Glycosyltransferase, GT2 family n=1 Tax=Propionispora hippei DSM 15287 TaxID=1123003 RepID=A0A1M6G3D5_9FIRM|nr:glycosyltransferase [Propionispora hippei]SHJ04478.1 Glycosyltransferase, GT2 family [Propionispora hippei DSM 15287]
MKTSIIIWACNQLQYLTQTIASIRTYTEQESYELIVVDDHSTDGTTGWLSQQTDIKIITNEPDKGYAEGCNQAIAKAAGETIVLLESDVIVTHHWLDNLTACLYSEPGIGAVAPVTNYGGYAQAVPVSYQSIDEMHSYTQKYNLSNSSCWEERIKLAGYCLAVRKTVIDSVGLLDGTFSSGYLLDDDYSFRIRAGGYKLMLCRDTFVHHAGAPPAEPVDYRDMLNKFAAKWGFNPVYSTIIRQDIVNLIENPKTQAIVVLEIGCACGATLMKIKDGYHKARLYGIELNEKAALSAKLFAEVIAADIENTILPYPKEYFDYIILADVLEHLENPWRALENIKAYIKPGGQILASIPNIMHFSVLRNLLQGFWSYEEAGILDKTHLRFFTIYEIEKMFQSTGYKMNACHPNFIHETAEDRQFILALTSVAGNNRLMDQCRAYQYIVRACKPVDTLPAGRPAEDLRRNKLCFITCENDDPICLSHIRDLEIPDGYEIEILSVKGSVSRANAYNQAIGESDAKYKIYLHENVVIINKNFIRDILQVFEDSVVGLIGVAGSTQVPANGIWWEANCTYGKVFDSHRGYMELVAFQNVENEYQEVQCIDGLIMITQYDLPWREDLFNGWHFYDCSQSMEFIKAGYKVVVPRQQQPWCIHDCGIIGLTNGYHDYRRVFVDTYLKTDV